MLKKICVKVVTYCLLFGIIALTACKGVETTADAPVDTSVVDETTPTEEAEPESEATVDATDDTAQELTMLQLMPLQKGEELAVLHTTMGDIKLRFFPDEAPLAVENFITHAKAGYYDGLIFHRVINDFMIQGGDPKGTGTGGESIWGGGFDVEFSLKLRHFRGALSMAHSQAPDSNGSQFFIVQNKNLAEYYETNFKAMYDVQGEPFAQSEDGKYIYVEDVFPTEVLDEYINNGGTPFLDLSISESGHTVFGHVVEGMDVVDAIAAVEVDSNDKPLTEVVIESISFEVAP